MTEAATTEAPGEERTEWSDGDGTFTFDVAINPPNDSVALIEARDQHDRLIRIYVDRVQHYGDPRPLVSKIIDAFTLFRDDRGIAWLPPTAWAWMQACTLLNRMRAEREHLRANHADLVARNALLRERPDLPVDRLPAHDELVRLQEQRDALASALKRHDPTLADALAPGSHV